MTTNITGVTQAVNETGTAADELSQQSELLRTEVDKFLANVRAA